MATVDLRYHPQANCFVLSIPDHPLYWEICSFPLSLNLRLLTEADPDNWLASIVSAPRWVQAEAEPPPAVEKQLDKVIDLGELDL